MIRTFSRLTVLFLLSSVISPLPLFADNNLLSWYHQKLKKMGIIQVEDKGKLCEHLAEIDLKKLYPSSQYYLLKNLNYYHGPEILGEIDVMVVSLHKQNVVAVVEVKCRRNEQEARVKAKTQLLRVKRFVSRNQGSTKGCHISFESDTDRIDLPCRRFYNTKYLYLGPKQDDHDMPDDYDFENTYIEPELKGLGLSIEEIENFYGI